MTEEQSAAVILLCCGSGLDEQSPALVLIIYLLAKSQAVVPADRNSISPPSAIPVRCGQASIDCRNINKAKKDKTYMDKKLFAEHFQVVGSDYWQSSGYEARLYSGFGEETKVKFNNMTITITGYTYLISKPETYMMFT
ncbi:MAG: hypothetical protein IPQ27_08730 [Chitinophagaceae bacterium]|nr:hypothetical protein [Chitinophagaceae bacterium]